ncbi:amidohydrolase [Staphylococcus chromogenes]|nr:amidohydrolase [Staphylococcus chromogenes]
MNSALTAARAILADLDSTREKREQLYKEFHQMPELSMQETRTSARIRAELEAAGIAVRAVGSTGLVAVIENGDGPVVAFRADIDALPMHETSGKDYAATGSTAHTCGHDFHLTSLLTACQFFHTHREAWHGTFIGVFQPGEETAEGARDMVKQGISQAMPRPDVYLGQHVLGGFPAGQIGTRKGPVFSSAFSVRVEIFGKGSHGSMPELSVDPVVIAASIVTRLQTIVSREVAASETAVVTVGAIHAGTKSNIIPDSAELLINTRAYSAAVAEHLKEAIERIVQAECAAARAPQEPTFTYYDTYPLTDNDGDTTDAVAKLFDAYFATDHVELPRIPASEDFSIIPTELGVPYTYWGVAGFRDWQNAPGNHNPAFAPDIQPTLDRSVEAIVVAACGWLGAK